VKAYYARSNHSLPPTTSSNAIVANPGTGSEEGTYVEHWEPRNVVDEEGSVWVVLTESQILAADGSVTSTDVKLFRSDDEGEEFELVATQFVGGKHGTIQFDPILSRLITAAFIADPDPLVNNSTRGKIQCRIQSAPGSTSFDDAFDFKLDSGATLYVEDDTFHLVVDDNLEGTWTLTCRDSVGGIKHYFSTDHGATWKEA
jgi:hypothetical protein